MVQEERRRRMRRTSDCCNISPSEVGEVFLRLEQTCLRMAEQQKACKADHDLLMQRSGRDGHYADLEKKIDRVIAYQDNAKGAGKFILWSTAVLAALGSIAAFIWKELS